MRRERPEVSEWMLSLPFTTPLSLNDRAHWRTKARLTKEFRDAANMLCRSAKIPSCERVRVTLIYTPRDKRRRDPLNLIATLKACEDGVVDARVVPDDTPQYVESQMPLIDMPDSQAPGLFLFIERVL